MNYRKFLLSEKPYHYIHNWNRIIHFSGNAGPLNSKSKFFDYRENQQIPLETCYRKADYRCGANSRGKVSVEKVYWLGQFTSESVKSLWENHSAGTWPLVGHPIQRHPWYSRCCSANGQSPFSIAAALYLEANHKAAGYAASSQPSWQQSKKPASARGT